MAFKNKKEVKNHCPGAHISQTANVSPTPWGWITERICTCGGRFSAPPSRCVTAHIRALIVKHFSGIASLSIETPVITRTDNYYHPETFGISLVINRWFYTHKWQRRPLRFSSGLWRCRRNSRAMSWGETPVALSGKKAKSPVLYLLECKLFL